MKNTAHNTAGAMCITTILLVAVFFLSIPGFVVMVQKALGFVPVAHAAAQYGKELKTAEFILGGGSDNTLRGDNVLAYAGATSWSTTKPSLASGATLLTLLGTGINVIDAQMEVSYGLVTASIHVLENDVYLDVEGASSEGVNTLASEINSSGNTTATGVVFAGSGTTGYVQTVHDVTTFFETQTDTEFNAGIAVIAGVQIDLSAAGNRSLTTVKISLTYEVDAYDGIDTNYELVKTIRLPLDSTNASDTGSRVATCPASTTCSFSFDRSSLPDLTVNANILSSYVEVYARQSGAINTTFSASLNSGAGSPSFASNETISDDTTMRVLWALPVADYQLGNSQQTLAFTNAAGSQTIQSLGGEIAITYRYKPSAPQQAETVRYYGVQGTANPGTASTTPTATTVSIANTGAEVKNAWYRIQTPASRTSNMSVFADIGGTTSVGQTYQFTALATPVRAGRMSTIVHDLSSQSAAIQPGTSISFSYKFSATGNAPSASELFVTFVWDGDIGSAKTKTAVYAASQPNVGLATANLYYNRTVKITFPEHGAKTLHSSYLSTILHRSDTTVSASGAIYMNVTSNVGIAINDTSNSGRSITSYLLAPISEEALLGSVGFASEKHSISISQRISVADRALFSNEIIVTYTAMSEVFGKKPERQVRTVEYVFGGGTSVSTYASNIFSYVGSGWTSTSKPSGAGTRRVVKIPGTNVRVVHAYVDVEFQTTSSVNITGIDLLGDVTLPASARSLTDIRLDQAQPQAISYTTGGQTALRRQIKVTPLLSQASPADLAIGVEMLFGLNVVGPTRALSSMKLVVTYESELDFNAIGGVEEIKTVRFPLNSTTGTRGTQGAVCNAASCTFTYTPIMPDLAQVADIESVHFEVVSTLAANTNSNLAMQIAGGTLSSAFPWAEGTTNITNMRFLWSPPVGGSDFNVGVQQTLDIRRAAGALYGVGGEVVVTYRYNGYAPVQTETISYALGQTTAAAQVGSFGTTNVVIANKDVAAQNVWIKAQHAIYAPGTITLNATVGAGAQRSQAYAYNFTDTTRATGVATTYLDLSVTDAANVSSSTNVTAGYSYAAATNLPSSINAELYVTFTWSGAKGGPMTRTALYSAAQPGVHAIANRERYAHTPITIPKYVSSTFHDARMMMYTLHSGAASGGTTITHGTLTGKLKGTILSFTTNGDREAHNNTMLIKATPDALFGTSTPESGGYEMSYRQLASVAQRFAISGVIGLTYTEQHEYQQPTFVQKGFRLYVNNNALLPDDPWSLGAPDLAENAEMTLLSRPVRKGEFIRLRMNMQIGTTTLNASTYRFRLQYGEKVTSCSAVSQWTNVDGPAGASIWRGKNSPPTAGAVLSTNPPGLGELILSASNRAGTYEEGGVSALNPYDVAVGEYVEYDWNIEHNGATKDTAYCFRMIEDNGDTFLSYAYYPVVIAAPYTPETTDWRWYDDFGTTPLALKNTAPSSVENGEIVKLRIGVKDVANESDVNLRFAVQWSVDPTFGRGSTFVTPQGECTPYSTFCYADGVGADDASLPSSLLSGLTLGRYNEATSTSTFSPGALSHIEMEYAIKPVRQRTGQVYFFRLFDTKRNIPVVYNSGYSYPSFVAEGATLGVSVSGVNAGVSIAGYTTSATTTATELPFGLLEFDTSGILAHQLNIRSNAAEGFRVGVRSTDDLRNSLGETMSAITHPNITPGVWESGCLASFAGCFGYHTTDSTLFGDSSRFAPNLWAGMSSTTAEEIAFNDIPNNTVGENIDVLYRIEPHTHALAGEYTTDLIYIVTPVY